VWTGWYSREAIPAQRVVGSTERCALGRNALHDGIGGGGLEDASELPAGGCKQGAELFFCTFASAGEDQHLEIQEFAGGEVVAGVNYVVNDEEFAAGIDTFPAGFEDLDATVVGPVVNDVFHDVSIGARGNRAKHIAGRQGAAFHHGLERSVLGPF
jgi:hypothetical protein